MLLKTATDIAITICKILQPHCYNINIAGSIRRQKPDPGDIEIICRPLREPSGQGGLFENTGEVSVIKEFKQAVHSLGKIELGNVNGRQMKIHIPIGIKLDLFIPQDHDYFRIYAIRTGSAQYSNLVIANAWKQKGWVGTDQGLRRREDCMPAGENKWKIINPNGMKPPSWISEADFFEWLGVTYLDPRLRDVFSASGREQNKKLLK